MTVIAYRDGIIAADTLITAGTTRVGNAIKVRKAGPVLAAAAGEMSKVQAFLDWFTAGALFSPPFMGESDDAMIVYGRKLLFWQTGWDMLEADFYAIGCGSQIALGAMAGGASAEVAVRIACEINTACGGPITVLSAHE